MDRFEISEVNLGKREYICFELFEVWVLYLSLKEETMKNIHNQDVAELAHYIIVFYTQGLGLGLAIQEFYFSIYFFRAFEAIAFLLNLYSSWQLRYSTVSCCLMEWPAKEYWFTLNLCLWKENGFSFIFSKMNWQFIVYEPLA